MTEVKVPKLRFEGFDEELEDHSLGDLAWLGKGQGYSKADLRESGYPIFLYGRIYTNFQIAVAEVDTFARLQPGSLLSTGNEVLVPASGETSEDIATAVALLKPGVIIGGDLNVMRPFPEVDPVYLALRIGTGTVKETLARRAQGKSIVHLRNSDLRGLQFCLPQLDEQKQIGALLSKIDALIGEHKRKHAKLRQTKVALQQKMLPQGGANQPDLRLRSFSGEWTGNDLGALCDITIGRTPARNAPALWGGDVPWVSIADMTQGREVLVTKEMITSAGARAGRRIPKGTVLLSFKLTIGRVARAGVDLYTNEAIAALPVKRGVAVDPLFLMYFLQASDLAGGTNRAAMGATLNQEALREIKVLRPPTLDEQKAIGAMFSGLDDLIAAEQTYIGKLQQAKTGLLQKMFV